MKLLIYYYQQQVVVMVLQLLFVYFRLRHVGRAKQRLDQSQIVSALSRALHLQFEVRFGVRYVVKCYRRWIIINGYLWLNSEYLLVKSSLPLYRRHELIWFRQWRNCAYIYISVELCFAWCGKMRNCAVRNIDAEWVIVRVRG